MCVSRVGVKERELDNGDGDGVSFRVEEDREWDPNAVVKTPCGGLGGDACVGEETEGGLGELGGAGMWIFGAVVVGGKAAEVVDEGCRGGGVDGEGGGSAFPVSGEDKDGLRFYCACYFPAKGGEPGVRRV